MARRCAVTSKGVLTGNNVSHANNRTRRRFLPNLQQASFMSEALEETVKLRLTTRGIRTVEHRGGIDAYLMSTPAAALPKDLRALRKRIEQARAAG